MSAVIERFWQKVHKTETCWLWTGARSHGYGETWNGRRPIAASRFVWEVMHGPIANSRQCVCHHCDNPLCVRPDHLFLASQRENLSDMRRKGRGALPPPQIGTTNLKAKFTEDDIRDIRRLYAEGDSLRRLGRRYGVWYTTISVIVNRKAWAHVS